MVITCTTRCNIAIFGDWFSQYVYVFHVFQNKYRVVFTNNINQVFRIMDVGCVLRKVETPVLYIS
jgi:hypothetical protein